MRARSGEKGVVLVLVCGFILVVSIVLLGTYIHLRGRVHDVEIFTDRTKAYYLCETGASVAILDIGKGKIGTGPGKWTERTFNFTVGEGIYPIHYEVDKVRGQWMIVSSVDSPLGLDIRYSLKVGGRRAFPIFIKARPFGCGMGH